MLSGSPGDYNAASQTAIKTVLATPSDVSTSAVSLTLIPGSVVVIADIFFGTQSGATFGASQLSSGVMADRASLETAINSQFTADGIGMTTTVQSLLVPPQYVVVAPSPPSGTSSTTGSAEATGAGSTIVIIGAGAGGGVALLLVIVLILYFRRKPTMQLSPESGTAKATGDATPGVSSLSRSSAVPMGMVRRRKR